MRSEKLADPVKMITLGAPRLIRTDAELEHYTDALFPLTAKEEPTTTEVEAIELLTMLVERYEAERFPPPEADPVEVLRFLMERDNLTQRDLAPEIGSEPLVSLILTRKRNLTLRHIFALAQRFGVPASVFLGVSNKRAA